MNKILNKILYGALCAGSGLAVGIILGTDKERKKFKFCGDLCIDNDSLYLKLDKDLGVVSESNYAVFRIKILDTSGKPSNKLN